MQFGDVIDERGLVMEASGYGTVNGVPITDEIIDRLVANAEAGFPDVTPRRAAGRPPMGDEPATTVTVLLDADLHRALIDRVASADTNASDVIREALRKFFDAA